MWHFFLVSGHSMSFFWQKFLSAKQLNKDILTGLIFLFCPFLLSLAPGWEPDTGIELKERTCYLHMINMSVTVLCQTTMCQCKTGNYILKMLCSRLELVRAKLARDQGGRNEEYSMLFFGAILQAGRYVRAQWTHFPVDFSHLGLLIPQTKHQVFGLIPSELAPSTDISSRSPATDSLPFSHIHSLDFPASSNTSSQATYLGLGW